MLSHIVDLIDGKVALGGEAELLRGHINNDQDRVGGEPLHHLIDGQIRLPELGPSVVPSHNLLLG